MSDYFYSLVFIMNLEFGMDDVEFTLPEIQNEENQ